MYSNLVKADYEIKDMNLKELREMLVKQNNLTPLDILKGFHEKSNFRLEYHYRPTDENLKDIEIIRNEYGRYLSVEGNKIIQHLYDDELNSLFEKSKEHYTKITIEDVITYQNDKDHNLSTIVKNACWEVMRGIRDIDDVLKRKLKNNAIHYIKSYIEENFGEKYKLLDHSVWGDLEGLPYEIEVNHMSDIDFSSVGYACRSNSGDFSTWIALDYDNRIDSSNLKSKIEFRNFEKLNIYVHLSEKQAKEIFDKTINSVIYQNNSIGELEYLQNLESQPITLNFDSKSKKYQLIDGYKRLLYITDENLLKYSAPIKIFTDLNDVQFLSLLYASNVWKTEKMFHDRGFLFALKTRFGFEIPSSAYEKSFKDELSILQLYDFGGNLVHVHKDKLMNTLDTHKHLVNDMNMMYNFLVNESKNHKYDENICDEIKYTIIELVGELRRTKYKYNHQNELSEEFIVSIYNDDFINKLCAKKHLSTRTYVINYFRDKGIYNRIKDMIKNNLVIIEN